MRREWIRKSLPYRVLRRMKRSLIGAGRGAAAPAASGGFHWSEDGRRVWVDTPEPPHNLVNVLYNSNYCTMIDHCARGLGRHMTPVGYRNNVVENERLIYVRDDSGGGEYFTLCWLPVIHPFDRYRATAGLGYQQIEIETCEVSATWRIFVPAGEDPIEIWDLVIENTALRSREFSLFSYVSMKCDGTDLYSGELFRIVRYLPEIEAIFAQTDAEQHQTLDFPWHNGFMAASRTPESWDANPGPFIGGGGRTLARPIALERGRGSGSIASMWPPCASLHLKISLASGEKQRLRFILGACDTPAMVVQLKQKYLSDLVSSDLDRDPTFRAMQAKFEALTAGLKIATPEPTIDRMLNEWVKIQCHCGMNWGRWGTVGYRDVLQQSIGSVTQAPNNVRDWILAACRHQYADGFALRAWRPIDTHRNADSAAWLVPATTEYIKETGDRTILDAIAPYYDCGEGTVYEHLTRAVTRLHEDRGPHGLCLAHEGDWNDSLTGVCRRGLGESVWLSQMFARCCRMMQELCIWLKRPEEADRYRTWHAEMVEAINTHAWDGEWYLCALDDDGQPIGSKENGEGKIFLNMQSWSHLGGVASEDRWNKAWTAVRRHLDSGWGLMLNWPTYHRPQDNVGRLSYIRPGAGENGSVYTHGNAFMLLALLERGMADEALALWRAIHPANPDRPGAAMPNIFYNGFYGPDSEIMAGLADHAWTTGSGAWMSFAVFELMIGVRRTYEGLVLRPCLPGEWPGAQMKRRYRDTTYDIRIENPALVAGAALESISVDDRDWPVDQPLPLDGGDHQVIAILSAKPAGILYDWRPDSMKASSLA